MQNDDKRLERVEGKIDNLDLRLDKIDVHMAVYNEQLKVHIAGVNDARKDIKYLREHDVAPMQAKWAMVEGGLKVLGAIAAIVAAVAGIVQVVEFVTKIIG